MDYKNDRYKYDFLAYHEKDINWIAFVFILTFVNISLISLDNFIVFVDVDPDDPNIQFPLRPIVY